MQTWFEYLSRTWFEWGKPQDFDPDAYKSYEHSMSDYPQHWGALWPVYYNEPSQEEIDNQCPMFADPNIFLLDQGNYKLDKDAKIFCWKKDGKYVHSIGIKLLGVDLWVDSKYFSTYRLKDGTSIPHFSYLENPPPIIPDRESEGWYALYKETVGSCAEWFDVGQDIQQRYEDHIRVTRFPELANV